MKIGLYYELISHAIEELKRFVQITDYQHVQQIIKQIGLKQYPIKRVAQKNPTYSLCFADRVWPTG